MKIVHILANAPYNDYWGYQDNLLPKYQAKLGYEVYVLTTNTKWENNEVVECECGEYPLDDGVYVKRFARKEYRNPTFTQFISYLNVFDELCKIGPDMIFFHSLINTTIFDAIKYKKKVNPKCVIVQDSHMDCNNGRSSDTIKDKLIRQYFRILNAYSQRYVSKVYGVTPCRKTYAEEYYHISPKKTDVLIMGADDEKICFAQREAIRAKIRTQYGIKDDDFLVVTGGKITQDKNIHLLAQAVKDKENVKLLIFGKVNADFEQEYRRSLNENVIEIGWIDAERVYDYFFAADFVCFPGLHSVMWEQACASKVPCGFEQLEGMEHVNNGGNAVFISEVTADNLSKIIDDVCFTDKYFQMKKVAESDATDIYLYSHIAHKSIECIVKDFNV